MNIKAFLFDLDGVLTDTSGYHFKAWKQSARNFGIHIPDSFEPKLRGISRTKSAELIINQSPISLSDVEIKKFTEQKNEFYLEAIGELTPSDRLPGVDEIFRFARSHAILTALVSASLNAHKVITSLGMADWFDFIADPRKHPPKPAPDLFLSAAKALNITPHECLGFEDAPAGVKGIKEAQMLAIGIGQNIGADFHFTNLMEAQDIIQSNFIGRNE